MSLVAIFANVSCADLERSVAWYSAVFGRDPDERPMAGLAEWHEKSAGFQLHEDGEKAGRSTLTLIVSGLDNERERLEKANLRPGQIEDADYTRIVRLSDPDDNLVVFAEPNWVD